MESIERSIERIGARDVSRIEYADKQQQRRERAARYNVPNGARKNGKTDTKWSDK